MSQGDYSFYGSPHAAVGEKDVVLPPPLLLRDARGVVGLTTVPKQLPLPWRPFQVYVNYATGPPWVSFFFRVEPLTDLSIYVASCYGICFLLSHSHLDAFFTYGSSTVGVGTTATHWELTHGKHICILVMTWGLHQVWTKWLLPPLIWVGAPYATQSAVLMPFQPCDGANSSGAH